jgi:sialate O-acetylesterase
MSIKMKTITFTVLLATIQLLSINAIRAEVRLPAFVSSNMVLQRNTNVIIWGWADSKEKIQIGASWLKKPKQIIADNDGNWQIEVETTLNKGPQTIHIKSNESDILLENILFGEVWLCSGQSNMEQSVKGFPGQPTFGSPMAIVKSHNPNLRLFSVDKVASKTPLKNVEKYSGWLQASPENVAGFSAIGYFFGQQLQEVLDVPVGIIHSSWGGSSIQAWMSYEKIQTFQEVDLKDVDISKRTVHIPTVLFNSMINPLTNFSIKGVLWYQGESNRNDPLLYKKLFPAMVEDWRERWGKENMPFYFVQIAPFLYNNNQASQITDNSAFMREAQLECVDLIPNSGIAITIDIGDEKVIHPPKKKEVADRLLFIALNQTYGYKDIPYVSPAYYSQEVKDQGLLLKFKNAETGLFSYQELEGFEIAGEDRIFHPAKAKIVNGSELFIKNEDVKDPVAVRYAWRNWTIGSLYGSNLLPVSSFRTDDWD